MIWFSNLQEALTALPSEGITVSIVGAELSTFLPAGNILDGTANIRTVQKSVHNFAWIACKAKFNNSVILLCNLFYLLT